MFPASTVPLQNCHPLPIGEHKHQYHGDALYTVKSVWFSVLSQNKLTVNKEEPTFLIAHGKNNLLVHISITQRIAKVERPWDLVFSIRILTGKRELPCNHPSPSILTGSRGSTRSRSSGDPSSRDCHSSPSWHAGKLAIAWMRRERISMLIVSTGRQEEEKKWVQKKKKKIRLQITDKLSLLVRGAWSCACNKVKTNKETSQKSFLMTAYPNNMNSTLISLLLYAVPPSNTEVFFLVF